LTCGDGWFDIIYELSSKLDELFKKNNLNGDDYPACAQVKQKFGHLCFYMENIPKELRNEAYGYIHEAEKKATEKCEKCGSPAKLSSNAGWYSVMCDSCKSGSNTTET
jgi:hypothetical protein